jgi:hypothetical protein
MSSRLSFTGIAAALSFALAGCASTPQIPREVRVPVPVPCIAEPLQRPALLSDSDLLAMDDYGLIIGLARDRRVRQAYQAQLEAAVAGCTGL